jgi:hypothetical protein
MTWGFARFRLFPSIPGEEYPEVGDDKSIVTPVVRKISCGGIRITGKKKVILVIKLSRKRFGIKVDQKLAVIEAKALGRIELTPDLVCVKLTRL